MARIFLTGSSDGIGLAAARVLADQGHHVVLHARNDARAKETKAAVPKAAGVLVGDLSSLAEAKKLADAANKAGPWDSVLHNAGVGLSGGGKQSADGLPLTFAVNSLAPYVLTALMDKPKRLLYTSSSLHYSGDGKVEGIADAANNQNGGAAYNNSKLQNVLLANAIARRWPDVQSCSVDPGWVSTKMGGASAPISVEVPGKLLAAYAVGESSVGDKTGVYFTANGAKEPHDAAKDTAKQESYLRQCREISGIDLPQ